MKKSTPDQQTPEDTDIEALAKDRNLTVLRAADELPPVLAGHQTAEIRARAESFYAGVAELFERWVARRPSPHTQRAYRCDVLSFVDFLGIGWPEDAFRLLLASVADVHGWRDSMMAETKAPKTLNRRISSLSSFYKYLAGAAAELRLPINVPNPAHAQFIARESSDPLEGTRALTATRARQLMGLPAGDELLDFRATVRSSKPTSIPASVSPPPAVCGSRTFIRMASKPPSRLTRKATSTAPSASISPRPRHWPNISPRLASQPDPFSAPGVRSTAPSWVTR